MHRDVVASTQERQFFPVDHETPLFDVGHLSPLGPGFLGRRSLSFLGGKGQSFVAFAKLKQFGAYLGGQASARDLADLSGGVTIMTGR